MSRPVAAAAILCATVLNPATIAEVGIDDCLAMVRGQPGESESYRCFFIAARQAQLWSESIAALEGLLAVEPGNPHALLYLGSIESDRGRSRAADLLERAAELFADEGDVKGEIGARLSLADYLAGVARYDEQRVQIEQAVDLARAVDDEELIASTSLEQASYLTWSRKLTEADAILARLPDLEQLNPLLRARAHSTIAVNLWFNGRLDGALEHYRRSAQLYGDNGDHYMEAGALYNVALTLSKLPPQGASPADDLEAVTAATLGAAIAGGNRYTEASVRMMIGQSPGRPIGERIREVDQALAIYRSMDRYVSACFAVRLLARLVLERDPNEVAEALRLLDEAVEMARAIGSLEDEARALIVRAGVGSADRPDADIISDYDRAVEAVERLRDLQPDHMVRARMLWDWAFVYYRMAGYLLDRGQPQPGLVHPQPEDVDLAYRTVEKLRARILLDAMDSAQATLAINRGNAEAEALTPVLERIWRLNAGLRTPGLSRPERDRSIDELNRLRTDERVRRQRAAEVDSAYAMMRRPEIPGIADLQRSLSADEAMVLYQLSTRRVDGDLWYWNGGSFGLLVTPTRVDVVALDDEDRLADRVAVFMGLLSRRDALEHRAAASLYEDLLGPLLTQIDPSQTRRLIVVPDGVLHRLPFVALREDPAADPLSATYAISTVPSASLWYQQRRSEFAGPRRSALVLADPIEGDHAGDGAEGDRRTGLGPLPAARAEARAMARAVGGSSRVFTGSSATERLLKTTDLARYGLLHFATHAVVDPVRPEQSAIVLAPGGDEDGLLHIREIVGLDLSGTIVILSACASASGELTVGEGVLGLARAFFHAGAETVIATLWPVRDDEAERFVGDVSAEIARGASIGDAMDEVRRAWIARDEPTVSWAGFVLMGNAGATLEPSDSVLARVGVLPIVAGGILLVGLVVWIVRRFAASGG